VVSVYKETQLPPFLQPRRRVEVAGKVVQPANLRRLTLFLDDVAELASLGEFTGLASLGRRPLHSSAVHVLLSALRLERALQQALHNSAYSSTRRSAAGRKPENRFSSFRFFFVCHH
jgi:hypothetical protein